MSKRDEVLHILFVGAPDDEALADRILACVAEPSDEMVAAREREACAQLCEQRATAPRGEDECAAYYRCADAIRTRGEPQP